AIRGTRRSAGERKEQPAKARSRDLPGGVQLRRGAVRGGEPRPPRRLERGREQVREERERGVGRERKL
ncbi:MAG: Cation transport regulator chaB, partial [uncultured Rubrobacteraceae bacterium]